MSSVLLSAVTILGLAAIARADTASFVQTDTAVQGTWIGKYGTAGYAIPSGATNLAGGVQVSVTGAPYIWSGATSDGRALQQVGNPFRLASTWYSSSNFTIDVAFPDALPHLISLYAMDWDGLNRSETIDVLDATTGAVLNTQSLSGFVGGTYVTWQVTGHVLFRVTNTNPFANAVVGGMFFDAAGSGPANALPTVTMNAPAGSFTAPATIPLSATALDSDGTVTQVQFFANGTFVGTGSGTNPATFDWTGVSAGTYSLTAVATDNSLATTTSTAQSVTVNPAGGPAAAAATFVKTDSTTQGTWKTVYGSDSALIVNSTANAAAPSYATVTVAPGQQAWTWNGSTAEARALQKPGAATDRIAATWYAGGHFDVDVNIIDGQTHQIALYGLDYDFAGRSQRIEVIDAASAEVLDTRDVSGFSGGQYWVWQIAGHVTFRVTQLGGVNAVVAGVFFDSPSVVPNAAPTVTLSAPAGGPWTSPATVILSADASDDGSIASVKFYDGATFIGTGSGLPYMFTWTGVAAGTHSVTAVAIDNLGKSTTSNPQSVSVSAPVGGGSSATFVKTDGTTQGTWKTVYGSDAAAVVNAGTAFPSYAAVNVSGAAVWTWNNSTPEVQALQKPTGPADRIAAVWYSPTSFTIDVNINDGQAHQIALYGLDYPSEGRSQRIDVLNATSQAVLDTRDVNGFAAGKYWVYQVSGHVTFVLTRLAGPNAGVSGIFFDPAPGATSNVAPTVTLNAPTGGPWTDPATVGLSATAGDSDGSVVSLTFYDGATPITTIAGSGPYTYSWTAVAAGTHNVTAVATDNGGAATTSGTQSVVVAGGVVNPAPTVTLSAPAGSPWTSPATVLLSADASDDGSIASVKFYDGATFIGNGSGLPYMLTWTGVTAGTHTVTAVATDDLGKTATSNAQTVIVSAPAGSGPSATYVTTDTATQGTWRGVYGVDGYALAQVGTVPPAYGTIATTSLSWTWASPTLAAQALQQPADSSRIAATWYGSTNIDFAVNLTDGAVHQVALYALDFDGAGRSERIDVLNASTHAVLDSRTVSNFSAGQYWVYQVSGSVIFRVVRLTGPNAAISAVFVDPLGSTNAAPTVSLSSPAGGPFMAPATVTLSATANDSDGTIANVSFYNGATLIGTSSSSGSPYTFAWTGVAEGNYSITAKATDNSGGTTTSAPVSVTIEPTGGFPPTFASFVQSDITTEGSWMGTYGHDGYTLANMANGTANPSYATVTPINQFNWTWTYSTTLLHALQQPPTGTNRVASAWYSPSTFDVAVNLTDGQIHKVSIYCVDWSSLGRLERIDVLDAATNEVLDSKSLSDFNTGIYLTWQMRGNIIFRVTHILGGARGNVNAVFQGIFFDTP